MITYAAFCTSSDSSSSVYTHADIAAQLPATAEGVNAVWAVARGPSTQLLAEAVSCFITAQGASPLVTALLRKKVPVAVVIDALAALSNGGARPLYIRDVANDFLAGKSCMLTVY
jgi:hypothetical protein